MTSGNLTGEHMAELFIVHRDVVWRLAAETGPAIFAVSRGAVRQIDLSD